MRGSHLHLVVAITGASGVVYGMRLLEVLEGKSETHLIISSAGEELIEHELGTTKRELEKLANNVYDEGDLCVLLASGSFRTYGMFIIPAA